MQRGRPKLCGHDQTPVPLGVECKSQKLCCPRERPTLREGYSIETCHRVSLRNVTVMIARVIFKSVKAVFA